MDVGDGTTIDHEMWVVGTTMINVLKMIMLGSKHNHINQTKQVFIKS
jgi:hypothetical protein